MIISVTFYNLLISYITFENDFGALSDTLSYVFIVLSVQISLFRELNPQLHPVEPTD